MKLSQVVVLSAPKLVLKLRKINELPLPDPVAALTGEGYLVPSDRQRAVAQPDIVAISVAAALPFLVQASLHPPPPVCVRIWWCRHS